MPVITLNLSVIDRLDYLEHAVQARRARAQEIRHLLHFVADVELLYQDLEAAIDLIPLIDVDMSLQYSKNVHQQDKARFWYRDRTKILARLSKVNGQLRQLAKEAAFINPEDERHAHITRPELNDDLFDDLDEKIEELKAEPAKHPQEKWEELKESLGPRWKRMWEGARGERE